MFGTCLTYLFCAMGHVWHMLGLAVLCNRTFGICLTYLFCAIGHVWHMLSLTLTAVNVTSVNTCIRAVYKTIFVKVRFDHNRLFVSTWRVRVGAEMGEGGEGSTYRQSGSSAFTSDVVIFFFVVVR